MNRKPKPYIGRTDFLKALGALAIFIAIYCATVGALVLAGVR